MDSSPPSATLTGVSGTGDMSPKTMHSIRWRRAPIPGDAFPMGEGGGLCLGRPWKWFVSQGDLPKTRTLFAFDSRKEEYRIWQSHSHAGISRLLLRIEHHGAEPGWHAHAASGRDKDALSGPRRPVDSGRFPAIDAEELWRQSPAEEWRASFPEEPMSPDSVAAIAEALGALQEDITIRPVPFGLAVSLSERPYLGDTLRFYVSQLGREPLIFRLEDDGTTIPVLQALGRLGASRLFTPERVLGRQASGRLHFGPENRALFTPYFPLGELADRAADFARALEGLTHHDEPRSQDQPPSGLGEFAETGTPRPENDNATPSHGNAWTHRASYATV